MHPKNSNKCLFIILNIGPEAMAMTYQCEFTVKKDDLYYTEKGIPTILLPGMFNSLEDLQYLCKYKPIVVAVKKNCYSHFHF